MVVLLTRFIWYCLRADENCLLSTRYSGYILQVRWIKFVIIRCDVSSGFSIPKLTKIG